jgi:hypothetical protein
MSLVNWFKKASVPDTSPRLEALIARVIAYLKSRPPDEEIRPHIVGRAIHETELAAMTALYLLEKKGITRHHFGVYCGETSVPIKVYDALSQVPEMLYCETCDREHSPTDRTCTVEVFFTVDSEKLNAISTTASAA